MNHFRGIFPLERFTLKETRLNKALRSLNKGATDRSIGATHRDGVRARPKKNVSGESGQSDWIKPPRCVVGLEFEKIPEVKKLQSLIVNAV